MLSKLLAQGQVKGEVTIPPEDLGFKVPEFTEIIAFFIKFILIVAGIFALIYLILGAFSWVTSGGDKEKVEKAQQKIQAAVVGMIIIFVVLAIAVLIERMLIPGDCGLGITEKICIPKLIEET